MFSVKFGFAQNDIHSLYVWKISILERFVAMNLISSFRLSFWVFPYLDATTILKDI